MALMDWDTPPSIQQRQTRVFRAQAQRIVQRKKTERNLRDAVMFRKEARSFQRDMGLRRTEAKGFREDAQKVFGSLQAQREAQAAKRAKTRTEDPRNLGQLQTPGRALPQEGSIPLSSAYREINQRYAEPTELVGGRLMEASGIADAPFAPYRAVRAGMRGDPIGVLREAGSALPVIGPGIQQATRLERNYNALRQLPGDIEAAYQSARGRPEDTQARLEDISLQNRIAGGLAYDPLNVVPGIGFTHVDDIGRTVGAGRRALAERSIRAFPTRNSNEIGNGIRELTTGARSELGTDLLKWRPRGEVGHIITVNVPEAARGQGRAQVLIDQALEDMQRQGLRNATAEVETPAGARMLRRQGATFEDRMGTPLSLEQAQERANRGVYATIQLGERRRSARGLIASEVGGTRLGHTGFPDEPIRNPLDRIEREAGGIADAQQAMKDYALSGAGYRGEPQDYYLTVRQGDGRVVNIEVNARSRYDAMEAVKRQFPDYDRILEVVESRKVNLPNPDAIRIQGGPDEGLPAGPVPDFGPDAPDIEAMLSQQGANRRRLGEEFRPEPIGTATPTTFGVGDQVVVNDRGIRARGRVLGMTDEWVNVESRVYGGAGLVPRDAVRAATPEEIVPNLEAIERAHQTGSLEGIDPAQPITLYRGENELTQPSARGGGAWWTPDRDKANFYGQGGRVYTIQTTAGELADQGNVINFNRASTPPQDLDEVLLHPDFVRAKLSGGDIVPPREPPTGVADMGGEVPEDPFESARQAILNARDINVAERSRIRPAQYEETGRRIGAYESEYQAALKEGLSRPEAQRQAQAALGGEKLKTSPIEVALDETQKQAIWDKIDNFDFGRGTGPDYERFRVRSALGKLTFGDRLTEGEWLGLEKVLGKDVTGVLKAAQSEKTGSLNRLLEVALVPKAVLSAFDVSYPLRQGIMLGPRHPKEFGGNLPGMFKAFASEEAAQNLQRSILEDAFPIMLKDGGEIPFNQFVEETSLIRPLETGLTESEEAFQSQLAEKIPGLGKIVRASNRSFTVYGNKLRADVAKNIIKAWNDGNGSSMQDLQALSDMLNRFSGRGTLTGKERLTGLAKDFNNFAEAVFWAPKYRVSGPQAFAQMFNVRNPKVANQAFQNFIPYMAAGTALLTLASLNGLNVTLDPRSTDFGKVVFGNQRFNFWGTNQLFVRSLAQMFTGEKIDPDTGLVKPIEWGKVVERYARSGLAPEWSAIYDAIAGETYIGQEFPPSSKDEWITQAKEKLTPLFIQDVYDTAKYGDWRTLPIVAPAAALGGSFQAYEQSAVGKLDAIQQYEGIDEQTQYDITKQGGFLDQVSEERNRMVQSGTPQGDLPEVSQSIIEFGEAQGLPEAFIQAALYLNSEKWRTQNRTDEWYDFVIDNEDQLREENPRMFSQWLNEFLNMNRDKRLQETR